MKNLEVISIILAFTASSIAGQGCQMTSRDAEGPFYEPGGLEVYDIAPTNELADKGREIVLAGSVLDRKCNPVSGATVEIWYAGGRNTGENHRSNQRII